MIIAKALIYYWKLFGPGFDSLQLHRYIAISLTRRVSAVTGLTGFDSSDKIVRDYQHNKRQLVRV